MEYHWRKETELADKADQSAATPPSGDKPCQIEILDMAAFEKEFERFYNRSFRSAQHRIRFCKAELLVNAVTGTLAIPVKHKLSEEKSTFAYCITENRLLLIDNKLMVGSILDDLQNSGREMTDLSSPYLVLFDLLEYLICDDMLYLLDFEKKLNRLEEALLDGDVTRFERDILALRKSLSNLGAYYDQLSDMGAVLEQSSAERSAERERILFHLYCSQTGRLRSTVQLLKEYSLQLRELYQSQIDIRQNEIMKVLTIVTTIFMPLTLITGWFGMNFEDMPGLEPGFYYLTCVFCIILIAVEVWYFRKKKWL